MTTEIKSLPQRANTVIDPYPDTESEDRMILRPNVLSRRRKSYVFLLASSKHISDDSAINRFKRLLKNYSITAEFVAKHYNFFINVVVVAAFHGKIKFVKCMVPRLGPLDRGVFAAREEDCNDDFFPVCERLTPLEAASYMGCQETVEFLLRVIKKKPSNIVDQSLHLACRRGHKGVILLLLNHGFKPTSLDERRENAFDHAIEKGQWEVVKFLAKEKGIGKQDLRKARGEIRHLMNMPRTKDEHIYLADVLKFLNSCQQPLILSSSASAPNLLAPPNVHSVFPAPPLLSPGRGGSLIDDVKKAGETVGGGLPKEPPKAKIAGGHSLLSFGLGGE